MRRSLIKIIAYLFFSILIISVVMLGAEIVFRFMPVYDREWMDYNSTTIWRVKANNVGTGWSQDHEAFRQVINREGFNDVNHDCEKKAGVKRIMIIGDSYTAGLNYPQSEIFTGLLQAKLNEKFPGQYEIMNCATPAWTIDQELMYFIKDGKKYKPDYVLLMTCPNDIRESYTRNLMGVHDGVVDQWLTYPMTREEKITWKLTTWSSIAVWMKKNNWLKDVSFSGLLWKYFSRAFPDFPPDKKWDEPMFLKQTPWQVNDANNRFTALLSSFNKEVTQANAQFMVSIIPTKAEFDTTMVDTILYQPGKVSFWIDSTCNKMGIPFAKTYEPAAQLANPIDLFQSWEFHLNPAGHKFMSEQLFPFLQTQTK